MQSFIYSLDKNADYRKKYKRISDKRWPYASDKGHTAPLLYADAFLDRFGIAFKKYSSAGYPHRFPVLHGCEGGGILKVPYKYGGI